MPTTSHTPTANAIHAACGNPPVAVARWSAKIKIAGSTMRFNLTANPGDSFPPESMADKVTQRRLSMQN